MSYLDKMERILTCEPSELSELAREITDDKAELARVIVELAKKNDMQAHMRLAEVLNCTQIDGTRTGDIYSSELSAGRRYVESFLSCCRACRYPESEYIGVFINALKAPKNSALYGWRNIADEFLTKRAQADFDLVCAYVDRFDKTYSAYSVLLRVDRSRALGILVGKVLYERFIDKSAVRSVLMTCPDVVGALISAYDGMGAKERAAVVKILLPNKDDPTVAEFLSVKAANDRSKTVQNELSRSTARRASRSGGASKYFESLLVTGEAVGFGELCRLVGLGGEKNKYGEIAENIFFCADGKDGKPRVICFDGKRFFDLNGRKVKLGDDDGVRVLHPLDLERDDPIFSLDLDQPFAQLHRPIFEPIIGEKLYSKRFFGTFVTASVFESRRKKLGFELCMVGGDTPCAVLIAGDYAVGATFDGETFMCDKVFYYRASDMIRQGRRIFAPSTPLEIDALDKKTYSELTYCVARLFDAV